MLKRLMVLSSAFLLTACFGLNRPAPDSSPPPPPPPAELLEPCNPTPRVYNPDATMSRAQVERNLGVADTDLAKCEAKRALAIDAWPKAPVVPPQGQD